MVVTGGAYRATFRPGEGGFDLALKASDGGWRTIGTSGRTLAIALLHQGQEEHTDGRRAAWALRRGRDVVTVGQAVPVGSGDAVIETHLACADEGLLIGTRLIGKAEGVLWPLPRLTGTAEEWSRYLYRDEADRRHEGTIASLGGPPAYAGVSPWGDNGDTVARLSAAQPALILSAPDGVGLAAILLAYEHAWRGAHVFVQRHTESSTIFYPGFVDARAASERLWGWLTPMPAEQADAADRVRALLQRGAELVSSFQPTAPPVPDEWRRPVPDFPAALARNQPVEDIREAIVYTMGETTRTPEALDLARKVDSDVIIRGWFKWAQAPDLTPVRRLPKEAHAFGALFGGGITCSALYDGENGITREQLLDMATRGPDGALVDAWGQPGVRHGSLSSPAYLDYLFRWCREQMDAGVDMLFMDEHTAALGADEGFDDHSVEEFREYLLRTAGWPPDDSRWTSAFGVPLNEPAVCPGGDMRSFRYRGYLKATGHVRDPWSERNPLARRFAEFRAFRDAHAWSALTDRIRKHASSLGRKVLIDANGFAPGVDLQVAGVWNDTMMHGGRIDLSENGIPRWRQRVRTGRRVAGKPVPVALFHDWGFGDPPFPFLSMPVADREIWIRVRGAEIYAAGGFFAFPVLGPFGCNAAQDGTLGLIQRQSIFYHKNRDLYLHGAYAGSSGLRTAETDLSLAVWRLKDPRKVAIHVVNRRLADGRLQERNNVRIVMPTASKVLGAQVVSPDWDGAVPATVRRFPDGVEIVVPRLEAYAVAIMTFAAKADLSRIGEPARVQPAARWERPSVSEFRVGPNGALERADDLNGIIQGRLHTGMRNPPTFVVDALQPATLRMLVRSVATLGARLEIRLDGRLIHALDLPDRDGRNDTEAPEYNQEVTVQVPAGRHRVTLDNTGADWLTLAWIEWSGRFR